MLKLLDKEKILQISRETKGSEAYVKRFDGYQHLVVMLFGILKHFDSLRELEIGMKAEAHKLGRLGMNYLVRRGTLAEANIRRPQEFFAGVYAYLLEKYAKFLADSRPSKCYKGQTHEPKDWEKLLYMMDSTTITLFDNILKDVGRHPKSGKKKGGMKVHTCLVLQRVDGIDDEVVFLHVEFVGCFRLLYFLIGGDVGIRVDIQQALAQCIHLHLADGAAGCHQLAVAVGHADAVAVHDGDVAHSASNESLGAP